MDKIWLYIPDRSSAIHGLRWGTLTGIGTSEQVLRAFLCQVSDDRGESGLFNSC